MFHYHFQMSFYSTDYYASELSIFSVPDKTLSHENIWEARKQARIFLLKLLKEADPVRYHKISLEIKYSANNQAIKLGEWFVSTYSPREHSWNWNWEVEHHFLEKYQLYRNGDKELIAIESEYYQNRPLTEEKKDSLENKLNHFCLQFETEITIYSTEVAILYLLLGNREKAFSYIIMQVSPELQWLTFQIASSLAHPSYPKSDFQFMKKYETLYPIPLPFLS